MKTQDTSFGVNIWWTMPETEIDGVLAQTMLKKHGFEDEDMKIPSRQLEVSRAAHSFQDRRHKENRRVTEKIETVGVSDSIVYGILDRNQEGETVSFEQKTTIRMDKGSGAVTVEGPLKDEFMKVLGNLHGKITDADLRQFLRKVIRMCYGIPKRPTGGIYFVPAQYAGVVEQAQAALAELSTHARIYVERVMDGKQERQNVWESVESDISDRVAAAVAAVGRIERRASAVENHKEELDSVTELMKVYQALLGEEAKFEDAKEKIEDAARIVAEKMAELQPVAIPGPVSGAPKARKSTKGGMPIPDVAVALLKEIGKPMTVQEMVDLAVKRGLYAADCRDPLASFSSTLQKGMKKGFAGVRRVGRGIYEFAA
jgi:hypothetical protein